MSNEIADQRRRLEEYLKEEGYYITQENMYEKLRESTKKWTNHPDSKGGKVWRII